MNSNSLAMEGVIVGREGASLTAPITLTLNSGEMLVIHGSNGSGKSTLLKTVAGLLPPQAGSIRFAPPEPQKSVAGGLAPVSSEGDDLAPWEALPRPLYLGHKRGLSPSMSVYDNVAFWAKASGYPELTAAAMHYFDLTDIPQVTVNSLSAGWQQRVALTRLITMPSLLWLLDEPTANLDAEGVELLQSLMHSRLEQKGIILVASHMQMQGERIKTLNLRMMGGNAEPESVGEAA